MFPFPFVPKAGLEPALSCPNWILNPARLPIPPLRQIFQSKFVFCHYENKNLNAKFNKVVLDLQEAFRGLFVISKLYLEIVTYIRMISIRILSHVSSKMLYVLDISCLFCRHSGLGNIS